jgi:hypothetical protein
VLLAQVGPALLQYMSGHGALHCCALVLQVMDYDGQQAATGGTAAAEGSAPSPAGAPAAAVQLHAALPAAAPQQHPAAARPRHSSRQATGLT